MQLRSIVAFAALAALVSAPIVAAADDSATYTQTITQLRYDAGMLSAPRFNAALSHLRSVISTRSLVSLEWDESRSGVCLDYPSGFTQLLSALAKQDAPDPTINGNCATRHRRVDHSYRVSADCSPPQGNVIDRSGDWIGQADVPDVPDTLTVYDIALTGSGSSGGGLGDYARAEVNDRDATDSSASGTIITLNNEDAANDVAADLTTMIHICALTNGQSPVGS